MTFFKSRWFTRGWTLQELLAPTRLQFFDRDWKSFGTKFDLIDNISTITKIDLYALTGGDLSRLSVARRMSRVGNRQTTRLEDMAYCLLGIFGINMPLLYGEDAKAFIRPQEEILKITDDQSIFAWRDPTAKPYRDDQSPRPINSFSRTFSILKDHFAILYWNTRTCDLDIHKQRPQGQLFSLSRFKLSIRISMYGDS